MNGRQPWPRLGSGRGLPRPELLAVVAAATACAVVAVAAAGEPLRGADGRFGRLTLSPWLIVIPLAAIIVLGLMSLTGLRHTGGARQTTRRSRWLTLLAFVVLAALVSRLQPASRASTDDLATYEIAPVAPPDGGQSTAWPIWVAVAAGGLLAAGALLASRRRAPTTPAREHDAPAEALRAIDGSLADLAEPRDPREAVIAAYAHLLEGLDGAGAGRRRAEAPFEHVTRALATLGVRREPLRELTSLFAEARFSTHRITEDHRAAAVRALTEARADLEGVTAS